MNAISGSDLAMTPSMPRRSAGITKGGGDESLKVSVAVQQVAQ